MLGSVDPNGNGATATVNNKTNEGNSFVLASTRLQLLHHISVEYSALFHRNGVSEVRLRL
jgi:hypothetical protein